MSNNLGLLVAPFSIVVGGHPSRDEHLELNPVTPSPLHGPEELGKLTHLPALLAVGDPVSPWRYWEEQYGYSLLGPELAGSFGHGSARNGTQMQMNGQW